MVFGRACGKYSEVGVTGRSASREEPLGNRDGPLRQTKSGHYMALKVHKVDVRHHNNDTGIIARKAEISRPTLVAQL